jgi:3-deoxy-D-manno-octulosonic-acid transferase
MAGWLRLRDRLRATRQTQEQTDTPHRPEGELLWCHATSQPHISMALRLADRLGQAKPDLHVLLTTAPDLPAPDLQQSGVFYAQLPEESSEATRSFLAHWSPDLCAWTGGDLRPVLLAEAQKQGVPLTLLDADRARLSPPGWRLLPGGPKQTLQRFDHIMARDRATESHLRRRIGLRDATITVTGRLQDISKPLPYNESDREELAALLLGRPVWLAAKLQPEEAATVLAAHQAVIRFSHRALLILAPDQVGDEAALQPFIEAAREAGLRCLRWSEGRLPDEITQVILADTPGEMGLWYRVAPICFMGSSLTSGTHGSDPNEPAAHGSAILYGPNIRNHLDPYSKYAEAGAARIVRDSDTLAAAVQQLIPPDKAAAMAHAAWDIATQGAEVLDQMVEILTDALDRQEAAQ